MTIIRIKRHVGDDNAPTPADLANAELAFNEDTKTLYYGAGDDGAGKATEVVTIGGEAPVDTFTYGRKDATWTRALPLTGGTVVGDTTFSAILFADDLQSKGIGANLRIRAAHSTVGQGGTLQLSGGNGAAMAGGNLTLTAGPGVATGVPGGILTISGGPGGTDGDGGYVSISGGAPLGTGKRGEVRIGNLPTVAQTGTAIWNNNGVLNIGAGGAGGDFLPLAGGEMTGSLVINKNTVPAITTSAAIHLWGADGAASGIAIAAFGGLPHVTLRGAGGTAAAPTFLLRNGFLGTHSFNGHDGSAFVERAIFRATATSDWTTTSQPSTFEWFVTPDNTVAMTKSMVLGSDGTLQLLRGGLTLSADLNMGLLSTGVASRIKFTHPAGSDQVYSTGATEVVGADLALCNYSTVSHNGIGFQTAVAGQRIPPYMNGVVIDPRKGSIISYGTGRFIGALVNDYHQFGSLRITTTAIDEIQMGMPSQYGNPALTDPGGVPVSGGTGVNVNDRFYDAYGNSYTCTATDGAGVATALRMDGVVSTTSAPTNPVPLTAAPGFTGTGVTVNLTVTPVNKLMIWAAGDLYLRSANVHVERDPTIPLGVATKQYVDAAVTGGGGGITEPVGAGTWGRLETGLWDSVLPLTGGTLTGALTLAADAALAMEPVTLQQMQATNADYVLKDGDTMTGALSVKGAFTVANPAMSSTKLLVEASLTGYDLMGMYYPGTGGVGFGLDFSTPYNLQFAGIDAGGNLDQANIVLTMPPVKAGSWKLSGGNFAFGGPEADLTIDLDDADGFARLYSSTDSVLMLGGGDAAVTGVVPANVVISGNTNSIDGTFGNIVLANLSTVAPTDPVADADVIWNNNGVLNIGAGGAGGDFLPLTGGTLTGDLTIDGAAAADGATNRRISWTTNGAPRCYFGMLNSETGTNSDGSGIHLVRVLDDGTELTSLRIPRGSGSFEFGNNVESPNFFFILNGAANSPRRISWATGMMQRWAIGIGGTEGTADAGGDLVFSRYNDAGANIAGFAPLTITRSTGLMTTLGVAVRGQFTVNPLAPATLDTVGVLTDIRGGAANGAAAGGAVNLLGGAGQTAGGAINITAGVGSVSGIGAIVTIKGGNGTVGIGGETRIYGGNSPIAAPGKVLVQGGGFTGAAGVSGTGGFINIFGGATPEGTGGQVLIRAGGFSGVTGAPVTGGAMKLEAGAGTGAGKAGGLASLVGGGNALGAGGGVALTAGLGAEGGGTITLTSGGSNTATSGNVVIQMGVGAGGTGHIILDVEVSADGAGLPPGALWQDATGVLHIVAGFVATQAPETQFDESDEPEPPSDDPLTIH